MTIDPKKTYDHISCVLESMIFEGLVRNVDGYIEFALAEEIDISEDGLTYTFHLRDAFWSSGKRITAEDFIRNWKAILDSKTFSPGAHLLYPIKGAQEAKNGGSLDDIGLCALDEKTLQVCLENRTPQFLEMLAYPALYPTPPLEDDIDSLAYTNPQKIAYSGPFILHKWIMNNCIVFEKNPLYWNATSVEPEEVLVHLIDNDWTAYQMFEKKELDFIGFPFSQIPQDALTFLQKENRIHTKPLSITTLCQFNTKKFPVNNVNLRKAIAYAINKENLAKNISLGTEAVANTLLPPTLRDHNNNYYNYDPEKAREHLSYALQELNCSKEQITIPYTYLSTEGNRRLAQAIQQQLREVLQIELDLRSFEWKTFLQKLRSKDFVLSLSAWIATYNDPMSFLERFVQQDSLNNDTEWEDKEYHNLISLSCSDTNSMSRYMHLEQAEDIFMQQAPQIPLFYRKFAYVHQPHIYNICISSTGIIFFDRLKFSQDEML